MEFMDTGNVRYIEQFDQVRECLFWRLSRVCCRLSCWTACFNLCDCCLLVVWCLSCFWCISRAQSSGCFPFPMDRNCL